jgi:hypothetical protein
MYRMRTLAERKVKSHEAMAYFLRVLCEVDPNSSDLSNLTNERALAKVQSLYDGQGSWCRTGSSQRNSMDYLNAVTEYVDHELLCT